MSGIGLKRAGLASQEEAVSRAAYAFDEQKKRSKKARQKESEGLQVEAFLRCVVGGEQEKAERLLKETPGLALKKGRVTDLSNREFHSITGFQYALWALDWHMWKMLLKYLSKEAAAVQCIELEEKGTVHGKHFSLAPSLEALSLYMKNHEEWDNRGMWDGMEDHWCQQVGGAQRMLPAHVINEYCHPTRSFFPVPEFNEKALVRNMGLYESQKNCLIATYNGGGLGKKFGILRYNWRGAYGGHCPSTRSGLAQVIGDSRALQSLWKVRQQQREDLKSELMGCLIARDSLQAYLPSELTSMILGYL